MNAQYWRKYQSWKKFDYTIKSLETKSGMNSYENIPIVLEGDEDMLLIKVDLIKGNV